MTLSFEDAAAIFLGLVSLFSPSAAIGPIAAYMTNATEEERRRLAMRVALFYIAIVVAAIWLGHFVLLFLGISTAALTATGGIALFISGLPLMTKGSKAESTPNQGSTVAVPTNIDRATFVPITFPITIGGATIAYAIALSGRHSVPLDMLAISGIAVLVSVVVYITIRLTGIISRISAGMIEVLTRCSGIVLVSLSMQFFVLGVSQLYQQGASLPVMRAIR